VLRVSGYELRVPGLESEPQNFEYRMSKGGIASLCLIEIKTPIPSFDILRFDILYSAVLCSKSRESYLFLSIDILPRPVYMMQFQFYIAFLVL